MTDAKDAASVREFKNGVSFADLPDGGMVVGRVDADDVLLARRGNALFAVGAHCTHYHGPLVDGLIVDDTVRCPWHHGPDPISWTVGMSCLCSSFSFFSKRVIDVDAVGISRSVRDFQTPVGAFCASTGVAASTSSSTLQKFQDRGTRNYSQRPGR